MKTSRYSDRQLMVLLKQADSGAPVPALFREPGRLRCDNGPEFISQELETWAEARDIQIEFIQPGNPQQNACIERYRWLSQYPFESIEDVQDYATRWLWFYNHEWPNKANGGLPPKHVLAAA